MDPETSDNAFLWDMLEAARLVRDMASQSDLRKYLADRKLQWSVERGLEIIGEAARKVSESYKQAHP